ncbi:MAG TPA: cyanophycin synthetase, partial [Microbacterium sp.]|nr:cyanophycin synthetase [Microbacterium sp.]
PVDVLVLEVGMGGSWDSTNTADGDVAVFAPIDIDHADRLGETIGEIATVKAGIIKPGAIAVSSEQDAAASAVLRETAAAQGARIAFEGQDFALTDDRLAVGGQLISVTGLAGTYTDQYLPLYGAHQGANAALAIAAVEALIGDGGRAIDGAVLAEGLGAVTSPGRLQLIGIDPTMLVDAAHNPHGARSLARALEEAFDFGEWAWVFGAFTDKDAAGVVDALGSVVSRVFTTALPSERSASADDLAAITRAAGLETTAHDDLFAAVTAAREWAAESERRAIVIAGSVVLAGEAIGLAGDEGYK